MAKVETSNVISLRGSTDIVTDFFNCSVNSILYQRGVYPPESFKRISKYGLGMMITIDDGLISYLNNISRQLDGKIILLWMTISDEIFQSLADDVQCSKASSCDQRTRNSVYLGTLGIRL